MIRSAQFAIRQTARLQPSSTSSSKASLIIARTQASSTDSSEYEQIMRRGVYSTSPSKSPSMSRAYGASTTQSNGSAQQAVSGAYRSVAEPSLFEDYDLYEMHHKPLEGTHFSYYNASYDPNANGGETGSLI